MCVRTDGAEHTQHERKGRRAIARLGCMCRSSGGVPRTNGWSLDGNTAARADPLGRAGLFWRRTDDGHPGSVRSTAGVIGWLLGRNRYVLGNDNSGNEYCGLVRLRKGGSREHAAERTPRFPLFVPLQGFAFLHPG